MRHSSYVSLVTAAAAMSWITAAHLSLVAVGMMTPQDAPAPVCGDIDNSTTACAIVIEGENVKLTDIAARLREPVWRIIIDNPTLPVAWPLTRGTAVYVARTYPAPPDEF